jgi:hypothetical protein
MAKTIRPQGVQQMKKNEYFGCRIDGELARMLRERAVQNERTVGGELNMILRSVLTENSDQSARVKRQSRKDS